MPATTKTNPRLQQLYKDSIVAKTMTEFKLENAHQVPVLKKIVVNAGLGKYLDNQKLKPEVRDQFLKNFATIDSSTSRFLVLRISEA